MMFRATLGLAVVVATSFVLAQGAEIDLRRIDGLIRAQVDSGFSGVVLVARNDSILLHRAYAPPSERLSPDDAFWIASTTKSFTAAAILKLQEEGGLSVRDSIARFFSGSPADKRGISVHQLLTHTSGLGGAYTGGGIRERSRAVEEILAQKLTFDPGKGYQYGGSNYELLAAIVEVVSGMEWEDFVRQRLVRPAGLNDVGFACRPYKGVRPPVDRSPRAARQDRPISRVACDWGHKGATGMSATAVDLLKWARALRVDGPLGAAGNSANVRSKVFVRREPPFDISYGYGLRVYTRDDEIVELMYSGSGDNDHTGIVRSIGPLTVIVLSNAGHHGGTTWSSFVARQLPALLAKPHR